MSDWVPVELQKQQWCVPCCSHRVAELEGLASHQIFQHQMGIRHCSIKIVPMVCCLSPVVEAQRVALCCSNSDFGICRAPVVDLFEEAISDQCVAYLVPEIQQAIPSKHCARVCRMHVCVCLCVWGGVHLCVCCYVHVCVACDSCRCA